MVSRHSDFKRKMVLFALMVLVIALVASTAFAHTGLSSSSPADGETVAGPLEEVTFLFTGTPFADDDSVAVNDAAGVTILPASIEQDGTEIVANFDPPLGAGAYALAWRVRSDDTHFVEGTLSFVVEVAAPPPTAAPTTAAPVTPTTAAAAPPTVAPVPAPSTTPPVTAAAGTDSADPLVAGPGDDQATGGPVAPSLGDGSDDGETVTTIARLIMLPAVVAAVGILAFAALAFAGRRDELGTLIRAVRWLGVAVVLGAVLELSGLSSLLGGLDEALGDTAGRAGAARLVGGSLLIVGFSAIAGTTPRPLIRSLSAAVLDETAVGLGAPQHGPSSTRWRPTGLDVVGLIGAGLLVGSFAFDGHTVSRGPRFVHGLTSIAHVGGAAIWTGGLVALTVVLWRRHHDGIATHAVEMLVRFSVVAMAALVVTGLAGVVMALFIDTDVVGYVGTDWGRLMILKVLLVTAAAGLGAYNHFKVLPALTAAPNDRDVIAATRRTVTAEAGLVVAAALVTALLVAASTL